MSTPVQAVGCRVPSSSSRRGAEVSVRMHIELHTLHRIVQIYTSCSLTYLLHAFILSSFGFSCHTLCLGYATNIVAGGGCCLLCPLHCSRFAANWIRRVHISENNTKSHKIELPHIITHNPKHQDYSYSFFIQLVENRSSDRQRKFQTLSLLVFFPRTDQVPLFTSTTIYKTLSLSSLSIHE